MKKDPEKKQKQQRECQEAIHKHVMRRGAAMQAAAKDVLMVDGRRRPEWLLAAKRSLEPVIADRNRLMAAYMANPSSAGADDAVRGARKSMQRAVKAARFSWVNSVLAVVNADGTVSSADGNRFHRKLHGMRWELFSVGRA